MSENVTSPAPIVPTGMRRADRPAAGADLRERDRHPYSPPGSGTTDGIAFQQDASCRTGGREVSALGDMTISSRRKYASAPVRIAIWHIVGE